MKNLIDKLETYGFACEGGPLKLCTHWQQLKAEIVRLRDERDTLLELDACACGHSRNSHLYSLMKQEPKGRHDCNYCACEDFSPRRDTDLAAVRAELAQVTQPMTTPEGLGGIVNEDVLMCLAAEAAREDLEDGTRNILRGAHRALVKALRQAEGQCDMCGELLGDAYCVECAAKTGVADLAAVRAELAQVKKERQAVFSASWRTLLADTHESRTVLRVSAFIRIFAMLHRDGKAWDVPNTIAAALEGGANHIEELERATEVADQQLASLRGVVETLKGYVRHDDECESVIWVCPEQTDLKDMPCTCGLASVLSAEGK